MIIFFGGGGGKNLINLHRADKIRNIFQMVVSKLSHRLLHLPGFYNFYDILKKIHAPNPCPALSFYVHGHGAAIDVRIENPGAKIRGAKFVQPKETGRSNVLVFSFSHKTYFNSDGQLKKGHFRLVAKCPINTRVV